MTLIAVVRNGEAPWLVGDILVSLLGESSTQSIELPTGHDANQVIPPDWQRSVTERRTKVVPLSSKLVLLWSGSKVAGIAAMDHLTESVDLHAPALEDVRSALHRLDAGSQGLVLLGALADVDGPEIFEARFGPSLAWSSDEDVYAAGSGREDFKSYLAERASSSGSRALHPFDPIAHALFCSLDFAGREVAHGDNIATQLYGGFYDVFAFNGGKFATASNIQFYFRYRLENDQIEVIDRVLKNWRADGCLCVEASAIRTHRPRFYIVPSPLRRDGPNFLRVFRERPHPSQFRSIWVAFTNGDEIVSRAMWVEEAASRQTLVQTGQLPQLTQMAVSRLKRDADSLRGAR